MKLINVVLTLVFIESGIAGAAPGSPGQADSPTTFSAAPELIQPPRIDLPLLGKLAVRHARDIKSSSWSIGGETLDRDFTSYENYRAHIGPLGAKGIRLQAGWAKCEKKPGVYDWAWLDAVVNDALAQGVQPWLETSYGNTIYPGGGGTGLGGGFPKSAAALAAWDNWVRALAHHFKDRVHEWEIWNEPDGGKDTTAEAYTALFIRTATIIRGEQPGARIYALGLSHKVPFAEEFLKILKTSGKTELMDAITYHVYPQNPDNTREVESIRALLAQYAPHAHVREGETGAPSKWQPNYALANLPWTENTQAKWNLRRMLAHHAKDVPFNLFTIMDMHYVRDGKVDMNWKGQLAANPDRTVAYRKPSYLAVQRVFSIFDDTLERMRGIRHTTSTTNRLAICAWTRKDGGAPVVAVWFNGAVPSDSNSPILTDLTFPALRFTAPVYADLLTGNVYALPSPIQRVPIYDSPVLIAEKSALMIEGKAQE